MTKIRINTAFIVVVIVLAGLMSVAWAQGRGNGQGKGMGQGQGACCQQDFDGPMDDGALIESKLAIALDDEYKAQAFYAAVMEEYGEVRPFSRIINAEKKHAEALIKLYEKYGLEAPANPYTSDDFEFASLQEAAQLAVDAEIENAALYDELFAGVSDPDVIAVFENLQWASQERHLPAFQRFLDNGGQGPGMGKGQSAGKGRGNGQGCNGQGQGCRGRNR